MKSAGIVTSHLGSRLLIVESDAGQLPPLYTCVADKFEKPVGKIVDLYGSVSRPYLTVLCGEKGAEDISVGDELYVIAETKPDKSKKKFAKRYKRK